MGGGVSDYLPSPSRSFLPPVFLSVGGTAGVDQETLGSIREAGSDWKEGMRRLSCENVFGCLPN